MDFQIYKYPKFTHRSPVGSVKFRGSTLVPHLPADTGVAITDLLSETKSVFLPNLNIVPMDLTQPSHQLSFMGVLPCIGYQAVPFDSDAISKAWDPKLHPRGQPDNAGEFVSAETTAFLAKIAADPDVIKARHATAEGMPTWKIYQKPDGSYEPDRQHLHAIIVNQMLNPKAVAPAGEKPKAAILLGLPASGKTKVLRDKVPGEWTVVDADAIKERLPEYKGGNAGIVHKERGHVAETMLIPQAKAARQNLMFDATGKNADKMLHMVKELKREGYDVSVYHVDLPCEKAAARAYARFKESGRFVDPELIIREFDSKPGKTYLVLRDSGLLEHTESWNNDVERGAKPVKVDQWDK